MKTYSQGKEQQTILNHFFSRQANTTFLSIGENDGETLSNVRALALIGAKGVCVEPAPDSFAKLKALYFDKPYIHCINAAIGKENGTAPFYHSGTHLNNGDTSLLSTLKAEDYEKWKGSTEFTTVQVEVLDVATMLSKTDYDKFHFISIDAEGMDLVILEQMDLTTLGCELLCIEWNSNPDTLTEIMEYCKVFGLTNVLLKNAENVILSRN